MSFLVGVWPIRSGHKSGHTIGAESLKVTGMVGFP